MANPIKLPVRKVPYGRGLFAIFDANAVQWATELVEEAADQIVEALNNSHPFAARCMDHDRDDGVSYFCMLDAGHPGEHRRRFIGGG